MACGGTRTTPGPAAVHNPGDVLLWNAAGDLLGAQALGVAVAQD
jgi:hypothetical protein